MYCVDTNIIIDILRGDKNLGLKIENMSLSGKLFFITPITLCELYLGAYGHINPNEKIAEVESFISNFDFLNFNKESCKEFGKLNSKLRKKGKTASDFDLMIAAIVKSNNLILITRDRDFEEIDIKVEVW